MNKKEKIELQLKLDELKESQNSLRAELKETPIENGLEAFETLDKQIKENAIEIIKLENELEVGQSKNAKEEKGNQKQMKNYIESKNAVIDMIDVMKNSKKKDILNNWNAKLKENGVEVEEGTESNFLMPRKLVEAINSTLLEANPVYKIFRITNVGALLINGSMEASDRTATNNYNRAGVHKDGEAKKEQSVVIKESKIEPVMVYKLQKVAERIKQLNVNFNEIWNMLVAEMTQAIVDKIVELALVEGTYGVTGKDENGYTSIASEAGLFAEGERERIKPITATANAETGVGAFQSGVEEALDFVRGKVGTRFLIITSAQRTALLNELRETYKGALGILPNTDRAIADLLGIDEIIVYSGVYESKASITAFTGETDDAKLTALLLKPTVIRDKAFHVDMNSLTRVEAFEWKTNENALLLETLTAGHVDQDKAGAVITLP